MVVGIIAILMVVSVVTFIVNLLINYICYWRLYEKAGIRGWKALIPVYNTYTTYKVVWGSGWMFLLSYLPIGGLVVGIVTQYKIAKCYGKGNGWSIAMLVIPYVFLIALAFGNSVYTGPRRGGKTICIILASALTIAYSAYTFSNVSEELKNNEYQYYNENEPWLDTIEA